MISISTFYWKNFYLCGSDVEKLDNKKLYHIYFLLPFDSPFVLRGFVIKAHNYRLWFFFVFNRVFLVEDENLIGTDSQYDKDNRS